MSEEEIIASILSAKTLYAVLNLDSSCTPEDVKRSYRRIAIKIHPDRCKHAKATEAFQRVSHAYQTLSNAEKRANYDRFGERSESAPTGGAYSGAAAHTYTYTGDVSPEELFEMLFGIDRRSFRAANGAYRNFNNFNGAYGPYGPFGGFESYGRQHRARSSASLLYRIGMLVLLLAVVVLPSLFRGDSAEDEMVFDDLDMGMYNPRMHTSKMKSEKARVTFAVTRNYMRRNGGSPNFYRELRQKADVIYIKRLKKKCRYETVQNFRSKKSCDKLDNLRFSM